MSEPLVNQCRHQFPDGAWCQRVMGHEPYSEVHWRADVPSLVRLDECNCEGGCPDGHYIKERPSFRVSE